ncbi:TetR family transcriptional regulator [Leucobacter zeae]|nr:TetR family transcriptional regulator [Leucobacter zeae]
MVSSGEAVRVRKQPEERRAEILTEAATIALADGLERITLRTVAERLGVRPGLISHYFPVAEDLVIAAFELAIGWERERLFAGSGAPMDRLAAFIRRVEGSDAVELSALWLNARHLARFLPALAVAIDAQEALDRELLVALIEDGVAAGEFVAHDALGACIRIFVAVDGFGAYVNNIGEFEHPVFRRFVSDVCAWSLGIDGDRLRARIDAPEPVEGVGRASADRC